MPILIDGWNFIRDENSDIDDLESDSIESVANLIACLKDFQQTHNDPITVVFDSKHEFLSVRHEGDPKLKIVAAKDADRYIKEHIDRVPESQRRNLRVVSSDTSVYYHAKSAYAIPVKCEEFWHKLAKGKRR